MNNSNQVLKIFLRYFLILISSINGLFVFYFLFTPLTTILSFTLFSIFFNTVITGTLIEFDGILIEIVPACVAGSAYFLLFALNLSVPEIKIKKRIAMVLASFSAFLLFNVLRIFILGILINYNLDFFDVVHKLFWIFISTIFIIIIWFSEVKLFKIKSIPFYSDLRFIYNKIKW